MKLYSHDPRTHADVGSTFMYSIDMHVICLFSCMKYVWVEAQEMCEFGFFQRKNWMAKRQGWKGDFCLCSFMQLLYSETCELLIQINKLFLNCMLYLLMMQTSNTPLSLPRTLTRLSLPSLWQEELNTEAPCVERSFRV